jgi:uncharacterized protein (TIGR03437 family)
MKRFGVLLLAASTVFAADFVTGQAARAVIGQPEFAAQHVGPYVSVMLGGTVTAGDVLTVTIDSASYTYTVLATDVMGDVAVGMANAINTSNSNAGDTNAIATAVPLSQMLWLTSRQIGTGATFTTAASVSEGATLTVSTAQIPGNRILGAASSVAYSNGILAVADSSVFRQGADPQNNRVLIYRDINAQVPAPAVEVPQTADRNFWCPLCGAAADVVVGQPDFITVIPGLTQSLMRLPTSVATDGQRLAVSDTDNNRILLWNSLPTANGAPADLVLGQPDFATGTPNSGTGDPQVPSSQSLRGPEGIWIQDGKLMVADSMNHRVLIWNTWPAQNFQAADVVVGQPDFSTQSQADLTQANSAPTATSLLNPASVTSDGVRLFVADLGHHRVMIWDTIPTQNGAAANLVVGQPDFVTSIPNNGSSATGLCPSDGTDSAGEATYPGMCGATLSFPRYALSDGTRLFIADGGNDRVLVFNSIPTANGATADAVLGQPDATHNITSDDTTYNPTAAALAGSADTIRTPCGLAWDGANLYVAEPFSRRVVVYTAGVSSPALLPVRNAASMEVFAVGSVALGGTITVGNTITITVDTTDYVYTVKDGDTLTTVAQGIAALVNEGDGDPNVFATAITSANTVYFTARVAGDAGNAITLSSSTSSDATITATLIGMLGGDSAGKLAAGSLVALFGQNLSDQPPTAAPAGADPLPTDLGGVQVYINGIRAPLLYTSADQINAQIPFELATTSTASLYVRTTHADGSVTISTTVGLPIVAANPGIFSFPGDDPRVAVAVHSSNFATGAVDIENVSTETGGVLKAGDQATITINDRAYTYTVVADDTIATVRDALIQMIHEQDPEVDAYAGGQFVRVRLVARTAGSAGNGIPYTATNTAAGTVSMATYSSALCCANVAGSLVTADNPALPGETIVIYATGLGAVIPGDGVQTGHSYQGPYLNRVANFTNSFVSAVVAGTTGYTLYAGLLQGAIGLYEVDVMLPPDLTTNLQTTLLIAQNVYTSNTTTFPVVAPSE